MEKFLSDQGLTRCSNDELLEIAELYNRLGHKESSCGAWFMRYSITGFIDKAKKDGIRDGFIGDPSAVNDFLKQNPALEHLR